MKCGEFETIGFDVGRDVALSRAEREGALEHVRVCPRCAAAYGSWQEARVQLRGLAEETRHAQAPVRVEVRLRQEFRARARMRNVRLVAALATCALAIVAVWVGAVKRHAWRPVLQPASGKANRGEVAPPAAGGDTSVRIAPAERTPNNTKKMPRAVEAADNEFTFLLGSIAVEADDGAILRVGMQRGALGALGLPVNEERAGEWIHVDVLVGADGQPQAVRLAR